MKNKYKKFLLSCNADLENQIGLTYELKIIKKLKKKGYISEIEDYGWDFLFYLSKKGVKKVKKLLDI